MRVNQVAQKLGISPDTIRFYTRIQLLNPERNPANGYREYNGADVRRLRFILSARQLGFSVEDIGSILAQADSAKSPCPTVRRLIEQRLQELEVRLAETQRLRDRMRAAIARWDRQPDCEPDGDSLCHLIEDFGLEREPSPGEPSCA